VVATAEEATAAEEEEEAGEETTATLPVDDVTDASEEDQPRAMIEEED